MPWQRAFPALALANSRMTKLGFLVEKGRNARTILCILLLVQGLLLAYAAGSASPTLNEPGHLVAGLYSLEFGRFDLYRVNPPLVRMVAALPVSLAGAHTDWTYYYYAQRGTPAFDLGEAFVRANGPRSTELFTLARCACIPFSLLGGAICFCWARQLYGPSAAFIATVLWCCCPNILAHGALITPDVAATSIGAAACYTFWRWLKDPTWWRAITSGLVLGIAELAKFTLIVFVVLGPVLWIVYRWTQRHQMARGEVLRELGMLAARMMIAGFIVNLGYGYEGTFTPLRDYRFVSATLGTEAGQTKAPPEGGNRFARSWLGALPVPLPTNYLSGIDLQKRDFEEFSQPSYLRGQFSAKGWWYYYLYALSIKVPLGTWLLLGLATLTGFLATRPAGAVDCRVYPAPAQTTAGPPSPRGVSWRDEFALLAPAIVTIGFVSAQTGFSQHMRYVLPAFPYVFIWAGRTSALFDGRHRVLASAAVVALLWSIGSSFWVYPHSLSYFNELAGGPLGGPRHLIHSNVDWGQDLLHLKKWLAAHPAARPIKLAYFGYLDPRDIGVDYIAPDFAAIARHQPGSPTTLPPGWYAVSVNFERGFPFFTYNGDGTKSQLPQNALQAFQAPKPVATAGYSIYIYHVEPPN